LERNRPKLATEAYLKEARQYQLVKPLVGGGWKPFSNDLQMPVRGGTIRGLMRFWWRATCGNRFDGLEQMRAAEMAIWGSTDRGSLIEVRVEVESASEGKLKPTHKAKDKPDGSVIPAYISWPLNPSKEKPNDIKKVLTELQFILNLSYPREFEGRDLQEEVRLTLWAFEFFGGVGARTRRGAGALCRVNDEGKALYSKRDLDWGWSRIQSRPWSNGVPHLDTALKAKLVRATWSGLANSHKAFFSEQFSKANRENLSEIKLRRTALGAPFKWKQVKVDERLASPVIYRPIRLKEGDFFVVVALKNLGRQSPPADPSLVKAFFESLGGHL
jgi:CRISPR type III-B/RAMP module RAMP protein Cmr1